MACCIGCFRTRYDGRDLSCRPKSRLAPQQRGCSLDAAREHAIAYALQRLAVLRRDDDGSAGPVADDGCGTAGALASAASGGLRRIRHFLARWLAAYLRQLADAKPIA